MRRFPTLNTIQTAKNHLLNAKLEVQVTKKMLQAVVEHLQRRSPHPWAYYPEIKHIATSAVQHEYPDMGGPGFLALFKSNRLKPWLYSKSESNHPHDDPAMNKLRLYWTGKRVCENEFMQDVCKVAPVLDNKDVETNQFMLQDMAPPNAFECHLPQPFLAQLDKDVLRVVQVGFICFFCMVLL